MLERIRVCRGWLRVTVDGQDWGTSSRGLWIVMGPDVRTPDFFATHAEAIAHAQRLAATIYEQTA